ncbi:hypothetical protein CPB86DRAFT_783301 [Serendipita vermifera]|nr:hypothetical protein CPB86DRAFT_783301 [Serendipita vermifera]
MLHTVAKTRFTRRDALLVLFGAFTTSSILFFANGGFNPRSTTINHAGLPEETYLGDPEYYEDWKQFIEPPTIPSTSSPESLEDETTSNEPTYESGMNDEWDGDPSSQNNRHPTTIKGPAPLQLQPFTNGRSLKSTKVLMHAPGWTMFENLYMSNGTLFLLSDPADMPNEGQTKNGAEQDGWLDGFPLRRMMTSTGLWGYATEESYRDREPTDNDMTFLSVEEAEQKWGENIWEIKGHTWIYNDPNQFLSHFYHFVAESLFSTWAFYVGTLSPFVTALGEIDVPSPDRAMFIRCTSSDIRDSSKFNMYYLKSTFPSMSLETAPDWQDRVFMTRNGDKAWYFPRAILSDRSASFRGRECGEKTQRIASEAIKAVGDQLSPWWWEPIRRSTLVFAGVSQDVIDMAVTSHARFSSALKSLSSSSLSALNEKYSHLNGEEGLSEEGMGKKEWPIVITYINRQGGRRSLNEEDHQRLVNGLTALAQRRGWEFNDVKAQHLPQEEQMAIAAKTTVLVGVHGNGLSHLLSMAPTRLSTLVEIFGAPGFARDYEWTARTLQIHHYSIWNDTSFGYPELPTAQAPEEFQSNNIPVHADFVVELIENRLDGVLGEIADTN